MSTELFVSCTSFDSAVSTARYFLYDVTIAEEEFEYVGRVQFIPKHDGSGLQRPAKICMSPNKRFMLISGVLHNGQESLAVYVTHGVIGCSSACIVGCMSESLLGIATLPVQQGIPTECLQQG